MLSYIAFQHTRFSDVGRWSGTNNEVLDPLADLAGSRC